MLSGQLACVEHWAHAQDMTQMLSFSPCHPGAGGEAEAQGGSRLE